MIKSLSELIWILTWTTASQLETNATDCIRVKSTKSRILRLTETEEIWKFSTIKWVKKVHTVLSRGLRLICGHHLSRLLPIRGKGEINKQAHRINQSQIFWKRNLLISKLGKLYSQLMALSASIGSQIRILMSSSLLKTKDCKKVTLLDIQNMLKRNSKAICWLELLVSQHKALGLKANSPSTRQVLQSQTLRKMDVWWVQEAKVTSSLMKKKKILWIPKALVFMTLTLINGVRMVQALVIKILWVIKRSVN